MNFFSLNKSNKNHCQNCVVNSGGGGGGGAVQAVTVAAANSR